MEAISQVSPGVVYLLAQEQASQVLLLSFVRVKLSKEVLRQELEVWGHVHALDMDRRREGIFMVLYYALHGLHNSDC